MKTIILSLTVLILSSSLYGQRKFGKVEKSEIEKKAHDLEPEASAAVLYRDSYTTFNYTGDKGFFLETTFHEVIKIYNSEGYDRATINVPMYRDDSAYETVKSVKGITYNIIDDAIVKDKLSSKAIFEDKLSDFRKMKKFTLPNIQDGSVIEYSYKFSSPFTFNINEFVFQEDIPVDEVNMRFYAPEYFSYRTHSKGWVPFTINNDARGRKIKLTYYVNREGDAVRRQGDRREQDVEFQDKGYIVNMKNVPSIKKEDLMNNINNYTTGLQFELAYTNYPNSPIKSYATNWEDVAKTIYKSSNFGGELNKVNYFKKDLATIIAGANSEVEKIGLIFSHIKKHMTWNEYRGAYTNKGVTKAYKDGVGNVAEINLMLTAMLREAGFDANPVLISTKDNGIPLFPAVNAYNYVITGVAINNGVVLMDAADHLSSLNLLDENLLNWNGRLVRQDGSSKTINLQPSKVAVHNAMLDLEFDPDFALKGKLQSRYSGHYARNMREALLNLNDEEKIEFIEKGLNAAVAQDLEIKELRNVHKPLSLSHQIDELEMVEIIGDKIYISPALFLGINENIFKSEERKFPVDFGYKQKQNFIVHFKIPQGYAVESLPKKLLLGLVDNITNYRYDVNQMGDVLKLTISRSVNSHLIAAGQYLDLKSYYKMIVEKEAEKIVLKKV